MLVLILLPFQTLGKYWRLFYCYNMIVCLKMVEIWFFTKTSSIFSAYHLPSLLKVSWNATRIPNQTSGSFIYELQNLQNFSWKYLHSCLLWHGCYGQLVCGFTVLRKFIYENKLPINHAVWSKCNYIQFYYSNSCVSMWYKWILRSKYLQYLS